MARKISCISTEAALLLVLGAFCFSFTGEAKPKKQGEKAESKPRGCDAAALKKLLFFDGVRDRNARTALEEKRNEKLFKMIYGKGFDPLDETGAEYVIFDIVVGNYRSEDCTEAVIVYGVMYHDTTEEESFDEDEEFGDPVPAAEGVALIGLKGKNLVLIAKSNLREGEIQAEAIDVDQDGIDELVTGGRSSSILKWKDSKFVELLKFERKEEERVNPPYKVVKQTPIKYLSSGPGIFDGVLLHVEECSYEDQYHKKQIFCFEFCKQISIDHNMKKTDIKKLDEGCQKVTESSIPFDVPGLSSGVTAIATGWDHTCALLRTGGVKCWGENGYGQLGDGTTTERSSPVDVLGLSSDVTAIATGWNHTCALLKTGGVKCWGWSRFGQLGDGTTTDRTSPVAVSGLSSGVTAIATGAGHTCALLKTGGVKCWGGNYHGQLGDGTTTDRTSPVDVLGLSSGVTVVATGFRHTCALLKTGGIKCWGNNMYGQLGDGTTTARTSPVDVLGLSSDVTAIATGRDHTCALLKTGGVKCWGDNWNGQLGDGTTTESSSPVDVSGLSSGVTAIATGTWHTCALLRAGGVKCWGNNMYGQLGDGTTTDKNTPVDVWQLSSGVSAITAGEHDTCALLNTGGVKCWGATKGVLTARKK